MSLTLRDDKGEALTHAEVDENFIFLLSRTRERLTGNTTFYVSPGGSDTNDGRSPATPFATIQKAVDVVCSLDLWIHQATIQLSDGTYTSGASLKPYIGTLAPIIKGNAATPANCLISPSGASCYLCGSAEWVVKDQKLQTAVSGSALYAFNGGNIRFSNLHFGACAGYHVYASNRGMVVCEGNFSITGSAQAHIVGVEMGVVSGYSGKTVTITGTPAFSTAFLYLRTNSAVVFSNGITWSGSATGQRYNISLNSSCFVNGASTTYLPGNASGITTSGGQYA